MIKLLHVVKYSPPSKGGMETYVHDLLKGIRSEFDITVLSDRSKNEDIHTNKFEKDGIYYTKHKPLLFLGNQPISFNFLRVYRALRKNDIVHFHFPYPTYEVICASILFLIKRKPKVIVTYHANPIRTRWKYLYKIISPFTNYLFKISSTVIFTSEYLLEETFFKILENKKIVIPIGIYLQDETYLHRDYEDIILFVGKFREYKGLPYLIQAMKDVRKGKCVLIGSGEEEERIRNLIKISLLEEKIEILGELSDKEVLSYYQKAKVFVLPSINESEAFGIVQLEALRYGVPVINTKLNSGVPYVSLNGISGITVPPCNKKQLAKAINKIMDLETKEYNLLSIAARKRCELFDMKLFIDKLKRIYVS